MEKSKIIYLDYASATPLDKRVVSVMNMIFKKYYANPSAIHELGIKAKEILEETRRKIAKILYALPDEIVFTSGATESNNLAILGVVSSYYENFKKIPHIITTNIEHSSVLELCKYLEKTGKAEVTYLKVEADGIIDLKKIRNLFKLNTALISVMYANNEIGTVEPIQEIAKEIRHYKKTVSKNKFSFFPIFHTDATQAINYLPINVLKLGVDLLSFNSAKIYGPKGIGVLFKKRNIPLTSLMKGGGQEFGLRPGTENTPLIAGLGKALEITEKIKEKESKRLHVLRDYFIKKILSLDSGIVINGGLEDRLPNNVNITIPKIPSDLLLLELSARGIYISEKSACKSGEKKGSYVIKAICQKPVGSLRFSLGRKTTKIDIDYTIKSLKEILKKLDKWYY